jgi:hypothetical protein
MNISSFEDLRVASQMQIDPQRLLFVFVGVELPDDCTSEQRSSFEADEGGALVPLMCVDKSPAEVSTFTALVKEASTLQQPWRIVFVAAMSGKRGIAPTSLDAQIPLQRMEEAIRQGKHSNFIPFDRQGQTIVFS